MIAPSQTTEPLADCARRLETLVQRSSLFIEGQLNGLREIGHTMVMPAPNGMSAPGEVSGGKPQPESDPERIEEQLEHLAKAWQELEIEQRRLMMSGQADQRQVAENAAATVQPKQTPPRRSLDLIEESAPQDAASAALQFQKLKREIRQQSRRNR